MGIFKDANTGQKAKKTYWKTRVLLTLAFFLFTPRILQNELGIVLSPVETELTVFTVASIIFYMTFAKWIARLLNVINFLTKD